VRRLRLRDEGGFSLVFTLLAILVLTVTLTAAIQFTTSNSRHATRSKNDQIAYALAEAGLANGAAVLSKPSNPAPSRTRTTRRTTTSSSTTRAAR
jgi:Tfp pilus assembly protein PilX